MELNEDIPLTLSRSDCLVLFDLLTRSYEKWREISPEDSTAAPLVVNAIRHGERVALWHLEGSSIERTLPELFSPEYSDLVEESLRALERQN